MEDRSNEENKTTNENVDQKFSFSVNTLTSILTKTYNFKIQGWLIALIVFLLIIVILD